jgi:CheY-like chemotaxis protein
MPENDMELSRHEMQPLRSDRGEMHPAGSGEAAGTVVALVADLLFASRIRGAAAAAGVEAIVVRTAEELIRASRERRPRWILVDLDARVADAVGAIAAVRAEADRSGSRILAFGAHVDREALRSARAAGADRVVARSAFVRELPGLLRGTDVADSGQR